MRRPQRRGGCTVTVGKLSLTIERVDDSTALIGLGFAQIVLSVSEMDQLERDLRQVRRELFPEQDDLDDWEIDGDADEEALGVVPGRRG